MLAGNMRHRDSAGNEGLLKDGGVQWMTAGRGVIHSELPEQSEVARASGGFVGDKTHDPALLVRSDILVVSCLRVSPGVCPDVHRPLVKRQNRHAAGATGELDQPPRFSRC
jgi:hypothetical protein